MRPSIFITGHFPVLIALLLPSNAFAQAGSLDPTFNGNGKVIQDYMSNAEGAFGVALQADGKIVSVGSASLNGNPTDFAVMRHFPDGTLDTSFGVNGCQITDIVVADQATSVAIQSDGKIVVAGYAYVDFANMSSVVVRYLTDGTLDTSFDGDGIVIINYAGGLSFQSSANAVAIQPDGKIVVAGGGAIGSSDRFVLARLNTNGSLDNSFSLNGKVDTDLGLLNGAAMAIAIQPNDGRIIVAGFATDGTDDDVAMQRYNTDGSLDMSFDGDGKVFTDLGTGGFLPQTLALQPDGKVVVAGSINYTEIVVLRYTTDGALDPDLGGDGMVTAQVGAFGSQAWALALQTDGKIVVSGFASNGLDYDFALARFNTDGTLDTDLDNDGWVLTDLSIHDEGRAMVIQPDGKILVAGQSYNGSNQDFALVRYLNDLDVGLIDLSGQDRSLLVYPNPLDEETMLSYTLEQAGTISVRLFDLEGRLIHTFMENRVQSAGPHQQPIAFPKGLASGSYMLVVSSLTGQMSIRITK